jgi:hypothetical protein
MHTCDKLGSYDEPGLVWLGWCVGGNLDFHGIKNGRVKVYARSVCFFCAENGGIGVDIEGPGKERREKLRKVMNIYSIYVYHSKNPFAILEYACMPVLNFFKQKLD